MEKLFGKGKLNREKNKKNKKELFEENQTAIDNQKNMEDKIEMSDSKKRESRIYVAFDMQDNVVTDKKGEIFVSSITETGNKITWPEAIKNKKLKSNKDYSVVVEIPNELSKDEKNVKKKEVKMQAIKDLTAQLLEVGLLKKDKESISVDEKKEDSCGKDEKISKSSLDNRIEGNDEVLLNNDIEFKLEKKTDNLGTDIPKDNHSGLANTTELLQAITEAENHISDDINNTYDDLLQAIGENDKENITDLKNMLEVKEKKICDHVSKTDHDASKYIIHSLQNDSKEKQESLISTVKNEGKTLKDGQDKLSSKLSKLAQAIDDTNVSCEMIEGKTSQIDKLVEILSDKGVVISNEIPPINAEEEDIINLVRYSQKISEQLGFAARELIRRKAAFESQEKGNANEQQAYERKIAEAKEVGIKQGKLETIKELLSTVNDVDALMDEENSYVSAFWNRLRELGVEIDSDGEYKKGSKVEITEISEKMSAAYRGLTEPGIYMVTKTGIIFEGEIIIAAEFEKVNEQASEDEEQLEKTENDSEEKNVETEAAEENQSQE